MTTPTTPTGKRLLFGQADPKDYMESLCGCGHMRSEHYNGQGGYESPTPCWYGWTASDEGCQCLDWSALKDGPIKPLPHEHTYTWTDTETGNGATPPFGSPCTGCGHRYGDPEPSE